MKFLTGASIILTEKCNLECTYCYEARKTEKKMSNDVLKKSIDFMINNSNNYQMLTIMWFGGEPLLNFEGLKFGVNYIKEQVKERQKTIRNFRFQQTIITNGTIWNDEIEQFFKDNTDIQIQLSWDGLPEFQDAQRGLSAEVEKTVIRLDQMPNHVSLHPIITPIMVDKLVENFDYMDSKFTRKIGFSPRFASSEFEEWIEDPQMFEKFRNAFFNLSDKYKERITTIANCEMSFQNPGTCSAGKAFGSFTPDGDIYACHRFYTAKARDFKIGTVDEGFIETPQSLLLEEYTLDNVLCCNECDAYQLCVRCIANNKLLTGDILMPGNNYCLPSKSIFFAVVDYVKKHKPHLLINEDATPMVKNNMEPANPNKVNSDLPSTECNPEDCPQNYSGFNQQQGNFQSNNSQLNTKQPADNKTQSNITESKASDKNASDKNADVSNKHLMQDDVIQQMANQLEKELCNINIPSGLTADQKIEYVILPILSNLVAKVDKLANKKCNCKSK